MGGVMMAGWVEEGRRRGAETYFFQDKGKQDISGAGYLKRRHLYLYVQIYETRRPEREEVALELDSGESSRCS